MKNSSARIGLLWRVDDSGGAAENMLAAMCLVVQILAESSLVRGSSSSYTPRDI